MKCILCDLRKAKRSCPAKSTMICPPCCAEKRVLEIDCPEDCQYLKTGRLHEMELHRCYYKSKDPMRQQKHARIMMQFEDFIAHLEYVLAEERQLSRYLSDQDAAQALDLLIQNLITEEKGVLYQRTSEDVRVDALRRKLMDIVQSHRSHKRPEPTADLIISQVPEGMKLRDVIDSLEAVREIIQNHLDERANSVSYIDFLARLLPNRARDANAGSGLIIPGR